MLLGFSVNAEEIRSFNSDIKINKDGTINVREIITYDFGYLYRHGIYRNIPYIKTNIEGKKFKLDFSNFSVTDENNLFYQYSQSTVNNNIQLKIGDPNRTITEIHTYIIGYTISGALTYFSDHDELYWNVTGNEWEVPIAMSTASVELPVEVQQKDMKIACYTGAYGISQSQCYFDNLGADRHKIVIKSLKQLGPKEGMTIVVGFPKNIVAVFEPKEFVSFWNTFIGRLVTWLLSLLALIWYVVLPFYIIYRWVRYGRDPSFAKASEGQVFVREVTAWFDPPRLKGDRPLGEKGNRFLTPGEVGTLGDETADLKDVSATIVDLARRGYLKIEERKKGDFYFIRKKDFFDDLTLLDYEKILLAAIFVNAGNLFSSFISIFSTTFSKSYSFSFSYPQKKDIDVKSSIQNEMDKLKSKNLLKEIRLKDKHLYNGIEAVKSGLYEDIVRVGLFPKNPQTIRTKYYVLAGTALFTGNFFLALVAFVFGRVMPRKTVAGVNAFNVSKSLKNFLVSQERQLQFQADKQMMFEKLLPYAIAFGVEKVWAKRFQDLNIGQPDWYQGASPGILNSYVFVNSLNSSMKSFKMATTPTRSSSGFSSGFGGGFSGGGGGGGGGGSW